MKANNTDVPEKKKPGVSDEDIIEGMKALHGYIDLTPHDFKLLYEKVYLQARQRILREYTAMDIMKSPALTIAAEETLENLILLLARHGHSGLPVTDSAGKLTGVVSTKDVLTCLGFPPTAHAMRLVADSLVEPLSLCDKVTGKTVGQIMSSPPLYAEPATSMADIAAIFREKCINRLPVADSSGKLYGLITRSDLINALTRLL